MNKSAALVLIGCLAGVALTLLANHLRSDEVPPAQATHQEQPAPSVPRAKPKPVNADRLPVPATIQTAAAPEVAAPLSMEKAVAEYGPLLIGIRATSLESATAIQAYIDALPEADQIERVVLLARKSLTTLGSNIEGTVKLRSAIPDPRKFAQTNGVKLTAAERSNLLAMASEQQPEIRRLVRQAMNAMEPLMASNYEARNLTITSHVLDSEGRGEQVQSQILAPKAQPSPGDLEFSSNWSNGGWTITNRISSADSELAKSLLDEAGRIRDGVVAQQNEFILGLRSD